MDFGCILDGIYSSLNQVRTNPKEAFHLYATLQKYYNGTIYKDKIKTRQGVYALRNLLDYLYLRSNNPMSKLKWSFALHMAADQQASRLGQLGLVTTQGTNQFVSLPDRCKHYALIKGKLSQVYQFGGKDSQQILQYLLIDDGLVSRKRRTTLLDPIFNYIGIGSCFHEVYGTVTVIILAQDVISLVAPQKNGKYRIRQPFSQGKQTHYKLQQQVIIDQLNQFLPSRQTNPSFILANNNNNQSSFILDNPQSNQNSRKSKIPNQDSQFSQYGYYKNLDQRKTNNQGRAINDGFLLQNTPPLSPSKYLSPQKKQQQLINFPKPIPQVVPKPIPKQESSSCLLM